MTKEEVITMINARRAQASELERELKALRQVLYKKEPLISAVLVPDPSHCIFLKPSVLMEPMTAEPIEPTSPVKHDLEYYEKKLNEFPKIEI